MGVYEGKGEWVLISAHEGKGQWVSTFDEREGRPKDEYVEWVSFDECVRVKLSVYKDKCECRFMFSNVRINWNTTVI